jgi:hypothetical protein
MEQHILGTQTIIFPTLATAGWDVTGDDTENDGNEYGFGITANSRAAFTARTDQFYTELKMTISDVSDFDSCLVGFRKIEAYQAAYTSYTDMAAFDVISGDIKTRTVLNSGTDTVTDTTQNWADAATHTLGVYVDEDGYVTYAVDGVEITDQSLAPQFRLDSADVMVPFLYFLKAASPQAGTMILSRWEVGKW